MYFGRENVYNILLGTLGLSRSSDLYVYAVDIFIYPGPLDRYLYVSESSVILYYNMRTSCRKLELHIAKIN